MASLVPALPGHVELQRERRLVVGVASREVPAGAAGALERLDLADEDAVHEGAGRIGRVGALGHEPVVVPLAARPRRAGRGSARRSRISTRTNRWIAGELFGREDFLMTLLLRGLCRLHADGAGAGDAARGRA